MTTLYCAICGERFEPDDRHVQVEGEFRPPESSRPRVDEFVFHPDCWMNLTGGWMDPA